MLTVNSSDLEIHACADVLEVGLGADFRQLDVDGRAHRRSSNPSFSDLLKRVVFGLFSPTSSLEKLNILKILIFHAFHRIFMIFSQFFYVFRLTQIGGAESEPAEARMAREGLLGRDRVEALDQTLQHFADFAA